MRDGRRGSRPSCRCGTCVFERSRVAVFNPWHERQQHLLFWPGQTMLSISDEDPGIKIFLSFELEPRHEPTKRLTSSIALPLNPDTSADIFQAIFHFYFHARRLSLKDEPSLYHNEIHNKGFEVRFGPMMIVNFDVVLFFVQF